MRSPVATGIMKALLARIVILRASPLFDGMNAIQETAESMFLLRRSLRALALLLALTIPGCSPGEGTKSSGGPVYGGLSLTVVVPSKEFLEAWDQPSRDWAAETGATVSVYDGPSAPPTSAGSVIVVPLERLPDLLVEIEPAEIPESLLGDTQLAWNDLLPGLRDHLGIRMRRPMLLPVAAPVLVCGFRQDLLEQAGRKPPSTWDEYDHLVRTVNEWAPGLVAVEPRHTDGRATLLAARALGGAMPPGQLGVYFDPETMSPRVGAPPFVRALTDLAALSAALDPKSSEMTAGDCLEALTSGKAAIALCTVRGDGGRRATTSGTALAIGLSALPGSRSVYDATSGAWTDIADGGVNRPSLVGPGTVVAVVVAGPAPKVEASWALMHKLAVSEQGQLLPASVRSPVRESQLDRVDLFCPTSLGGQSARRALAAIAISLRSAAVCLELPLPQSGAYRYELSQAVTRVLGGQATPDAALADVAKSWETRLGEPVMRDATRRVYRESLGFVGELSLTPLGNTGRPEGR
jgi:multiple sugar transport system substrate-binding protein